MNDEPRDIEFGRPVPPPRPVTDPFAGLTATPPEPSRERPAEPFGEPPAEPEPVPASVPEAGRRSRRARRRSEPALGGALETARKIAAHRYGTAALILLAASALYGIAAISRPGPVPAHRGEVVPVDAAVAVCPEAARSRIALASTGRGEGGAAVADLAGRAVTSLTRPGTSWSAPATRPGPLVVEAKGALAGGLAVVQTTQTKRALAGVSCTAPGTDHWFVSPGPGTASVDLFLANTDDVPATVDLHAISDDGSLATTDGKSLEVPAKSSRTVRIGRTAEGLGAVAADVQVIALRVTASSGRVAAAVRASLGAKGLDWVPAASAPSRRVVVPGLPDGRGRRTLYVGAPGDADARVQIRVITSEGVFAPEGQDVLDVPADSVIPLDLEAALGGRAAAVVLTSKQEIVAGFQAGGDEVSYGAAAEPLGEGGTVADARTGSRLLLTAPEGAAKVRITPLGQTGPGAAQEVAVAAGRTVEVPVAADAVRVEPLPGSGPVYGARVLTVRAGRLRPVTVLPLGPSPVSVRLPGVVMFMVPPSA